MDNYSLCEALGKGSFGSVWLAKNKTTNNSCVIKQVIIDELKVQEQESALNEVRILSTLRHKNIIRYQEAFLVHTTLCIVMEYADDGDLAQKINHQNGVLFLELQIIDWFVQLVIALKYIHSLNILHRDVKSQNVFITRQNIIKLGDFGVSKLLDTSQLQAKTSIGTPFYLSPEICRQKPYNSKTDIWSLGVVLYELTTLKYPFQAQDFSGLVIKILSGKYQSISKCFGPLLHDLLLVLLQVKPTDRPSASQLLKIPALQPHVDSYLRRVKHKESPVIFHDMSVLQDRCDQEKIAAIRESTCERKYSDASMHTLHSTKTSAEAKPVFDARAQAEEPLQEMKATTKKKRKISLTSSASDLFRRKIRNKSVGQVANSSEDILTKPPPLKETQKTPLGGSVKKLMRKADRSRSEMEMNKAKSPTPNFIERNKNLAATPQTWKKKQQQKTPKQSERHAVDPRRVRSTMKGTKEAERFDVNETIEIHKYENSPRRAMTRCSTKNLDQPTPNRSLFPDYLSPSSMEEDSINTSISMNSSIDSSNNNQEDERHKSLDNNSLMDSVERPTYERSLSEVTFVKQKRRHSFLPGSLRLSSRIKHKITNRLKSAGDATYTKFTNHDKIISNSSLLGLSKKSGTKEGNSKTTKKVKEDEVSLKRNGTFIIKGEDNKPAKDEKETKKGVNKKTGVNMANHTSTCTVLPRSEQKHVLENLCKDLGRERVGEVLHCLKQLVEQPEWRQLTDALGETNAQHLPAFFQLLNIK